MITSPTYITEDIEYLKQLKEDLELQYEQLILMKHEFQNFDVPLLGNPVVSTINELIALRYRVEFQLANYEAYGAFYEDEGIGDKQLEFQVHFDNLRATTLRLYTEYEDYFRNSLQKVVSMFYKTA